MSCQQKNFLADHRGWQGRSCQSWAELWSCGWQFLRLCQAAQHGNAHGTRAALGVQVLGGQEDEGEGRLGLLTLVTSQLQHQHPEPPTLNTP